MAQRVIQGFGTFRVTKSGLPSRTASTTHKTLEQAEQKAKDLDKLNPGKTWIVLPTSYVGSV